MAEIRAEQGAFGWAAEAVAPAGDGAARRQANRHTERGRPAAIAAQRIAANAGEGLPADNELWDVHAAARFLKRSVSWVYHKAEDGTIPVRRLGGWGIRFIPGELRTWVETGGAAKPR